MRVPLKLAPAAPVTSTSPSVGETPPSSSAITASMAVNPAVPTLIAHTASVPAGSGTSEAAGTRANSL